MSVNENSRSWKEISKGEGAIITLCIILFYVSIYWGIIQNGYFWKGKLTIAFFVGITFAFLAKIKPGTKDTLVFNHKELYTEWNDGLCLIPSLLPALHRIGLHLGWSLKEMHHETLSQEQTSFIHHDVKINSGNIQQVSATTDFWTLKKWEMFTKFIGWFFSKNKNPILVFQDFGLKIIIVALFLGCISLFTGGVVNFYTSFFPPKEKITYAVIGECINIPRGETITLAMTSLPRKYPTGLENEVQIITPKQMKITWSAMTKNLPQELPQEMVLITTSRWWRPNGGEICF